MGMKALGFRDVRGRIARGAEEEGLPLAEGSGSARAAAVLSQTWSCLTCLY